MTNPPNCLADFWGRWTISRRIEDRHARQIGHLSGTVLFAWNSSVLIYTEAGELRLPDQPGLATQREYLWQAEGSSVNVSFPDGTPFHRFRLSCSEARASHWCDPDRYDVWYDFSNWPDWTAIWTVRGPKKDYVSVTHFQRKPEVGN